MSGAEILAFCRARLDDEEKLALAAEGESDPDLAPCPSPWSDPYSEFKARGGPEFAHVLYHSPLCALAAVEADRAILDEIETCLNAVPADRDARESVEVTACLAVDFLRLLASRWSWHEDYRSGEWAP